MKAHIVIACTSAVFAIAYLIYAITTRCRQRLPQRTRVTVARTYDGLTFLSYLCLWFFVAVWILHRLPHLHQ